MVFFFSSRRRHTRSTRDWSSDVCSSDLINWVDDADGNTAIANISFAKKGDQYEATVNVNSGSGVAMVANEKMIFKRSEERRVGKECRTRWLRKQEKKKRKYYS